MSEKIVSGTRLKKWWRSKWKPSPWATRQTDPYKQYRLLGLIHNVITPKPTLADVFKPGKRCGADCPHVNAGLSKDQAKDVVTMLEHIIVDGLKYSRGGADWVWEEIGDDRRELAEFCMMTGEDIAASEQRILERTRDTGAGGP